MKDCFKLNVQGLKALKFISIVVVLQGLSGCSKMSGTFDCPYGKGVGCRSITEVNQMVNDGKLSGLDSERATQNKAIVAVKCNKPEAIALYDKAKVHRMKEEHLKVWVAPFEDEQGNFHEDSVIHTVLKAGSWHTSEGV
jgi:conjugal transfer pilus assembly protein TraV